MYWHGFMDGVGVVCLTVLVVTEELVKSSAAKWIDVTEDTIRVIRFNPDNAVGPYATSFAAYVEKEYASKVEAKHRHIEKLLELFRGEFEDRW